eukprot:5233446-Alexandrium_andersonii.AAC.1
MGGPPEHSPRGPRGPKGAAALCAMRLTAWWDLTKIGQWKDACDRPMAVAMAVLPQDAVVRAENEWTERREGNKV